jgi:cellulose synthase/poly-beta-1,6-N-acetylglucosamine synthase-like glycosyltransferase
VTGSGDGQVRVSVVVPTYRRPERLERCLRAVLAQQLEPAEYEILVCDDAIDPPTGRLVGALAATSSVAMRYLPVTRRHGPAAARNVGWRAARGEMIAFTDDDTIPQPGWLRAGLAAFDDPAVVGVDGPVEVPLPPNPTDYERDAAGLARGEFVTANCFYRRDVLEELGGFDERFRAPWREDSDLQFRAMQTGGRLVRAPEARVVHPVRPARWGVSLQQQAKSRFNALLFKKHPRLYRERIQAAPPWRYYGAVGSLLLASAGLLAARPATALAGLSAWLVLTTTFCAQRLRGTSRSLPHRAEMALTSALIPPLAVYWRLRGALEHRVVFL